MTRPLTLSTTLLVASAAAVGLSGCKLDNRPLLARRDTTPAYVAELPPREAALSYLPADYLPTVADLPQARALPVAYAGPERAWYYPEQAYRMDRAFYDAPPAYGFDYGSEEPWAWRGDDGLMFAEPIDDGYRYYYYEPDEAYPYFVRDRDYGYAYGDDGALVALFTAAGALLSPDTYPRYADVAGRYRTHAYDLNRAYESAPRMPVERTAWRQRAPALNADRQRWISAAQTQPPWRDYRDRYQSDGSPARQRQQIAAAPPLPANLPPGQAVAAARHEDKAWRDAARADRKQAKAEEKAFRQVAKHDDQAQRQQARAQAEAAQAAEVRARALRPIGQERPREQAQAAGDRGRNAGWRGPEKASQQHSSGDAGRDQGQGKDHGGEDHRGQDHGNQGHGGKGGGHGKGK